MNGKSLNIVEDKKAKLKELFPEIFTEDQIDWDKLKIVFGKDINFQDERYFLNWAGKSDAFSALQSPTTATLIPDKNESVNFDATENLFIEGENLEVLKILQKPYYNKVKMIYIDPPYNTGNDSFIYPDRFSESKEDYLIRTGSSDENGYLTREGFFRKNSKDGGHYHSNWLSMMYPRLFLARNLLKEDGIIFVSIDDNEVHNLRLLMNEIFGEENFMAQFIWKRRTPSALDEKNLSTDHEYVLAYSKQPFIQLVGKPKDYKNYKNPDNDPNGDWMPDNPTVGMTKDQRPNQFYDLIDPETGDRYPANPNRVWGWIPETMNKFIEQGRIIFPKDTSKKPLFKRYKKDLKTDYNPLSTLLLDEVGMNAEATKLLQGLFNGSIFNYSKPLSLLTTLIRYSISNDDIIMDFFSGSGTTAHAVLELNKEDNGNRKFILVQLPEKTEEDSESYKAGYKTIADIGKERIRRVIQTLEEEKKNRPDLFQNENGKLDLGFKVFKLKPSNFKVWRTDIDNGEELIKQMEVFKDPVKPESLEENMVYELLLKLGYTLTSKIEKKSLNEIEYYIIEKSSLILVLSGIENELIKEIVKQKPQKVIILDRLFKGDDQFKTNTALQMKDAGIEFMSI